MADVFLARDQLLDRPVAVKVLFPQFASEPTFVERFRREAQAAANLNHPSIVAVYDWGEHDNTYFIVMEYVEGRSLADLIAAEGTLHHDRAAEICTDVAAALGFAHRNGTVHRDVKPGNILITPSGQVKVTDFGIARAFGGGDELTQTGSVMGTATYFSPEQAQGKSVDPRSDLYSLGVVLFEMITGTPPFLGESPVAIAYKHVQEAPPRPTSINPAVPKTLEAVIARLLAKNPNQRYASAEDLRADLRRFLEGAPLAGTASAPIANNGDGASPGGAAAGAVAGAAAAGVVGGAAGAAASGPATQANRAVIDTTRAMPAAVAVDHEAPPEEYYEPPKRNGVFLALLAVLLLTLAGLIFYIADVFGDPSGDTEATTQVTVPDVVGETEETAAQILVNEGFEVTPVFELNPDVEPGEVFEQSPAANTEADLGSPVLIRISQAEDAISLPDVRGQAEADAVATLRALGLSVEIEREPSDEYDAGIVIAMSPEPQEVNPDALVTLTISSGPDEVEVPDVTGLTTGEASNALGREGLPNPAIETEASSDVEKGLVIRTDPPAGTPVPIDRRVILYVSDGPATDSVPPLIGLTQAAAEQAILNRGFEPVIEFVDVLPDSADVGKVTAQDPAANTDLEVGSPVTITIGRAVGTTTTTAPTTTTTASTTTTSTTAPPDGDGDG